MPTALVSVESFYAENFSLSTAVYAFGFWFRFAIHLFAAEFSSLRQHPNLRRPCSACSFICSVAVNPTPRDFLHACSVHNPLPSQRVEFCKFIDSVRSNFFVIPVFSVRLSVPFQEVTPHHLSATLCVSFVCLNFVRSVVQSCLVFIHCVQHQVPYWATRQVWSSSPLIQQGTSVSSSIFDLLKFVRGADQRLFPPVQLVHFGQAVFYLPHQLWWHWPDRSCSRRVMFVHRL